MTKKTKAVLNGAFLGALTGVAVVGLTYLGQRVMRLPFVAFDVFDWQARVLPGKVISLSIDLMVKMISTLKLGPTASVAKLAESLIAMAQLVAAGLVLGAVLGWLRRRPALNLPVLGAAGGLVLLAVGLVAEFSMGFPPSGPLVGTLWLTIVFVGWGTLLGRAVEAISISEEEQSSAGGRRRFLWLVGAGSFVVSVGGLGAKILSKTAQRVVPVPEGTVDGGILESDNTSGPAASPSWKDLQARIKPVAGTRPELTSSTDFYRIDIDIMPPVVDSAVWRLDIGGLVEKPLRLSLAEVRARGAVNQAITLSCISNTVGGDLISTAVWTGVPLRSVLAEAGLKPGVRAVAVEAADGFYESVPLAEAMDPRTLLVYAMNGQPLTAAHGFPLRVFIPGHYGMKQPKWITRLTAVDKVVPGYWVERGWDERAVVKTTSVVDAVAADQGYGAGGLVPVGGIAYAGARGISRVEIQVDDGPWREAQLRTPALSPLTWVQWRYDWPAVPGRHILRVRAYDGGGALQSAESAPPHPSGATGIHSRKADIRAAARGSESPAGN